MSQANPWNLTAYEVQIMESMICNGTAKKANREAGPFVAPFSVVSATKRIRKKMGFGNNLQCAVHWDRFARNASGQAMAQSTKGES